MQVTRREDKALETAQGRFQVGMWAPDTASEDFIEVTRSLDGKPRSVVTVRGIWLG